jgi:hypothetical protein
MAENNTVYNDDNNPALIAVGPDGTARNVKSDDEGNISISGYESISSRYTDKEVVIDTPQTLTTSWADVGSEIACQGYNVLRFWFTVDINNSNDLQFKAISKHTAAGSEYNSAIKTVGASDIKIEPEYFEFNVDQDDFVMVEIEIGNATPYVQLQAKVGTLGATAADLEAVYVTKGYK